MVNILFIYTEFPSHLDWNLQPVSFQCQIKFWPVVTSQKTMPMLRHYSISGGRTLKKPINSINVGYLICTRTWMSDSSSFVQPPLSQALRGCKLINLQVWYIFSNSHTIHS